MLLMPKYNISNSTLLVNASLMAVTDELDLVSYREDG